MIFKKTSEQINRQFNVNGEVESTASTISEMGEDDNYVMYINLTEQDEAKHANANVNIKKTIDGEVQQHHIGNLNYSGENIQCNLPSEHALALITIFKQKVEA